MVWALQGRTADCKVGRGDAHTMWIQLAWLPSTSLVFDIVVLIVLYVDPTGTATPGGTCIFVSSGKT